MRLLLEYELEPWLIFDGAPLPMKAATEHERAASRQKALAQAQELERRGLSESAREYYNRAVDVTPEMASVR